MCSPVCSNTVIGCTYGLHSGIYNMYVYDIEEEDRLSDDWATSSHNITITGVEQTCSSLKLTNSVSEPTYPSIAFNRTYPLLKSFPDSMVAVIRETCDCPCSM